MQALLFPWLQHPESPAAVFGGGGEEGAFQYVSKKLVMNF